jgi:hypothetical protein
MPELFLIEPLSTLCYELRKVRMFIIPGYEGGDAFKYGSFRFKSEFEAGFVD